MVSHREAQAKSWRSHRPLAALAIAIASVGGASVVLAIDDLQLSVERVEGRGWRIDDVQLAVDMRKGALAGHATIARIQFASRPDVLSNVRITCPAVELSATKIGCADARVAIPLPSLDTQQLRGRLVYDRSTGKVELDAQTAKLAGGSVRLRAMLGQQRWQAHVESDNLDLAQVLKLAAALHVPMPDLSGAGRFSATIDASGGASLDHVKVTASITDVTANNAAGTLASDKLTLTTRAVFARSGTDWPFELDIEARSGQAYAEPVFLDFGEHALSLRARGRLSANRELHVHSFDVVHHDVVRAEGSARVAMNHAKPLRDLQLELHAVQFPGAYSSYLQPFLIDTDFKSLQTSGHIAGSVRIEEGIAQQVALRVADLNVDDGTRKFVLRGVSGALSWRNAQEEDADEVLRTGRESSSLQWQSGSLLNLGIGAGALQFTTIGRNVRLIEPTRIPLLDGALEIESLRVRNVGLPSVAFMVDAAIRPISAAELCRAFGWPEFGGTLSGTISKLRMREGVVTLGTTLQAQVFDGRIAIADLRLEDALGQWPKFSSNIAIENLDLELVTRAFSFGRITGRLSGAIDGLHLFNWQPIAFDARLYTPATDRSKHRISQRAVENIGSIGGGGTGITQALSSGLLRFFEEFRYERLGLSCRLENEVCYMDGVAPAPNGGYYLVKGSGLPRIDVIGGARRVDWPRLVQQLVAMTKAEGAVVR